MSKFWRYFAASGVLLAMSYGYASADPPKAPALPVQNLQPGQAPLPIPPRVHFAKTPLLTPAKLGILKTHLKLDLTPANLDAPAHLDARTPWVQNGAFSIAATGVGQFYPTTEDGPYIDILPFGQTGSYHPHFVLSFTVNPDRGALIECAAGGAGGPWKTILSVQGAADQINTITSFPDGHLTAFVAKGSSQRTGGLMIRSEGNAGFAIAGCDVTPVKY